MIEDVKPKFETQDIQVPLGLELLIRGIFSASYLTGLNMVLSLIHIQNLSVIPGHQEFGILEETGENIDDLKMVIVRFYHGCAQQSAVQGFEEEEQRTIAILVHIT